MDTATDVRSGRVPVPEAAGRRQGKPFLSELWDFLISLKLAIWTLILLAVASIVGTVVEQNQPLEKYQQVYEDWAFNLMNRLNVFDMYHSWWFLFLLCLFAVNLTCCTIDRLPRTIRTVRNPKRTLDEAAEKSLGRVERWKSKGEVAQWAETYREALGRAFSAPEVTEEGGAVHLYAEKGVSSRFGAYATHAGIVIIFVGAIIGNIFGFKSYLSLSDGAEGSHIDIRGGKVHMDLPFSVRNNRFWMETYPNGQPKEYSSDLSVIENGREVMRKTITVNDPLVYKGIWFYQSGYGEAGAGARVAVQRPDGTPVGNYLLGANEPVGIEGYGTVRGVNYEENLLGKGPALQVVIEKPGQAPAEVWLLQNAPEQERLRNDSLRFFFGGLTPRMYTGLQVAKDPGVNVVWLGCLLLTAGMMLSFFVSHRRIWVRLSEGPGGKVHVTAGGTANRNRPAFEKAFAAVVAEIRKETPDNAKEIPA
ncbi:MAG: cytochrome c biogenesis protein ResB [Thermodesulfobacteriota bacterium]